MTFLGVILISYNQLLKSSRGNVLLGLDGVTYATTFITNFTTLGHGDKW